MKKINYIIFSILVLLWVSGCAGYKPIFSTKNLQFEITDYSIEGNKKLGNQIYRKLYTLSKTQNDNEKRSLYMKFKVEKEKNSTVKDNKGKILEYKIILNSNIQISDFLTNEEILNQNFTYSSAYKVQDQLSETKKLENRSIQNLIEKTYEEIVIKISENIL
tara:strand:+ start:50 stop:535 length:486 start_codon:yes stop_codon:yes gene_type:complete